MTRERDIDRILDHWFTERPTQVADRVLDEVADRIARQPQQPAWRVPRRDIHVQANLKLFLAAAAVIVIAIAGVVVLRPGSGSGVGGTATPSPSAPSSTSPSPSSASPSTRILPTWYSTTESSGAGILAAGSHTTASFDPGFSFTVPDGWVNDNDQSGYFGLFPDTPGNKAEWGRSEGLADSFIMGFNSSPYFVCESLEDNSGATAAEIVTAVGKNEILMSSEPVDITIGGLTGKQVDVRVDPDWTGTCPNDPSGFDPKDGRARGILLDTPDRGVLVMFISSLHSADHDAFVAKMMPIVESFDFDLGSGASPSPS